jgi:hypothetical protein
VVKRKEVEPCPNAAAHTPHPTGYLAHAEWAERKMKTHHQVKCDGCGLYAIWVPGVRAIDFGCSDCGAFPGDPCMEKRGDLEYARREIKSLHHGRYFEAQLARDRRKRASAAIESGRHADG